MILIGRLYGSSHTILESVDVRLLMIFLQAGIGVNIVVPRPFWDFVVLLCPVFFAETAVCANTNEFAIFAGSFTGADRLALATSLTILLA
jgi:hypothetical protein